MARNFNGADYVIGSIGALSTAAQAGFTIAAIVRRSADGNFDAVFSGETSGNSSKFGFEISSGGKLQLYTGPNGRDTASYVASDGWAVIAVNKATGTTTPRGHVYKYSTDAWTHTDSASTIGDDGTSLSGGRVQIGRWETFDKAHADIALVAVWMRSLSDAELERLPFSLQQWYALTPDALWLLDQADTGQAVLDSTGGGANQTSVTGTAVSTTSVPIFSYGFPPTGHFAPAGGAAPISGTGTEPAAVVGTGTGVKVGKGGGALAVAACTSSTGKKLGGAAGIAPAAGCATATGRKVAGGAGTAAPAPVVGRAAGLKVGVGGGAEPAAACGRGTGSKTGAGVGRAPVALCGAATGGKLAPGGGLVAAAVAGGIRGARPGTGVLALAVHGRYCSCRTHRPLRGTVGRLSTGTVTRPDTGMVAEPCDC